MKIITGSLKGKTLFCPKGIRPLTFALRKACFDILAKEIVGKNILDLFGGSGSLGIEAISQGASFATFVDIKKSCVEAIKKNLISLKILNKAKVYQKDANLAVKDFYNREEYFDIVFLDPPYYKGILRKILKTLELYDIVSPFGFLVCFCYIKDEVPKKVEKFSTILEKRYGQTLFLIYQHE